MRYFLICVFPTLLLVRFCIRHTQNSRKCLLFINCLITKANCTFPQDDHGNHGWNWYNVLQWGSDWRANEYIVFPSTLLGVLPLSLLTKIIDISSKAFVWAFLNSDNAFHQPKCSNQSYLFLFELESGYLGSHRLGHNASLFLLRFLADGEVRCRLHRFPPSISSRRRYVTSMFLVLSEPYFQRFAVSLYHYDDELHEYTGVPVFSGPPDIFLQAGWFWASTMFLPPWFHVVFCPNAHKRTCCNLGASHPTCATARLLDLPNVQ